MAPLQRHVPRRFRQVVLTPLAELRGWSARLAFRLFGPETVTVRPGWVVRCHPLTAIAFRQTRDQPQLVRELDRFIETCRRGMTLIDAGSHYGVFTLAALHYGGPDARVVAVDPSPHTQALLAINLALNGVTSRVTRIEAAVAARSGHIDTLTTGASQSFQMVRAQADRPDARRVPAVTLDDVAAALDRPVTHLKIDIEGHELAALQGGSHVLATNRPFVLLELHNDLLRHYGDSGAPVLDALTRHGYTWVCDDDTGHEVRGDAVLSEWVARLACAPAASK